MSLYQTRLPERGSVLYPGRITPPPRPGHSEWQREVPPGDLRQTRLLYVQVLESERVLEFVLDRVEHVPQVTVWREEDVEGRPSPPVPSLRQSRTTVRVCYRPSSSTRRCVSGPSVVPPTLWVLLQGILRNRPGLDRLEVLVELETSVTKTNSPRPLPGPLPHLGDHPPCVKIGSRETHGHCRVRVTSGR